MARNLTIFGPNRSRRRELKFEKFSNERANEQTNDLYKNFSKIFGGTPEDARRPDLNYRLDYFLNFKKGCRAYWSIRGGSEAWENRDHDF